MAFASRANVNLALIDRRDQDVAAAMHAARQTIDHTTGGYRSAAQDASLTLSFSSDEWCPVTEQICQASFLWSGMSNAGIDLRRRCAAACHAHEAAAS